MSTVLRSMEDHATTPALSLATWLCASAPSRPDQLTHLKLQKLAFYCYGGLLAFDLEHEIGEIDFQAWKHGPVSPEMYQAYKQHGGNPLPTPTCAPKFAPTAERVMRDVLNVYGRLTAWQLREESHCEDPWLAKYNDLDRVPLPTDELRAYFAAKFRGPEVSFPERLFGGSTMTLDRIPVPTFTSLADMSAAVTRILGAA